MYKWWRFFFCSVSCFFTWLTASFALQTLFCFVRSHWLIGGLPMLPEPWLESFPHTYLLQCSPYFFPLAVLGCRVLFEDFNFELRAVRCRDPVSLFACLYVDIQVSQHIVLSPLCISWCLCLKSGVFSHVDQCLVPLFHSTNLCVPCASIILSLLLWFYVIIWKQVRWCLLQSSCSELLYLFICLCFHISFKFSFSICEDRPWSFGWDCI